MCFRSATLFSCEFAGAHHGAPVLREVEGDSLNAKPSLTSMSMHPPSSTARKCEMRSASCVGVGARSMSIADGEVGYAVVTYGERLHGLGYLGQQNLLVEVASLTGTMLDVLRRTLLHNHTIRGA